MAVINLYENFQKGEKHFNDSLMDTFKKAEGYFGDKIIFLSHRSLDKYMAREISKKLENKGYTVYLDENDCFLRMAVKEKNGKEIVKAIRAAIEKSDCLLCLISESTNASWWVPYEVGIADSNDINIVSFKTQKALEEWIPEFLKINTVLQSEKEFDEHFTVVGLVKYLNILDCSR